jgi:ketosteroid isomerase-like protein
MEMTTCQVLAAIILLACSGAALSQSNATSNRPLSADTTKVVTAAEQTLNDALLRADWKTIQELYADDIVFTTADGSISHKSDSIREIQSGDAKFVSVEMSDVHVQDLGNVAVVTGKLIEKGRYKTDDLSGAYRFTDVRVKRDGRWQLVAGQEGRIQ